ncbi:MAG: alcohol dehydrogenase [Microbacterium sp.]|nr:alcohol dehydrogenase [Microbacterium sp.]
MPPILRVRPERAPVSGIPSGILPAAPAFDLRMKALTYNEFGGNDRFEITDREMPHIGPDTLVVRVVAAGLNPVDYKVREGYLQGLLDVQLPAVPGWDVAGVVEKVGLDTPEFQVGDPVLAYARADVVSGGSVAEYMAVPIHGAAGGVGSFGVQLARLRGARVIGTASERNHDYLRELGAEPVVYGDGLADRVREVAPEGVDVVLDFAGGSSLDSTNDLLREGGVVTSIADPRAASEFGGNYIWVRPDAAQLAELARLAADGSLRVEVAETFPLDDAAAAYARLEEGHTRGKIVVTV